MLSMMDSCFGDLYFMIINDVSQIPQAFCFYYNYLSSMGTRASLLAIIIKIIMSTK